MVSLTRQNVLIVLSVVTIAGGTMFGAGAFSQVQADRTVSTTAVGDGSAYLQLTPDSSYAQQDSNNELELTLDELNGNATTTVSQAFNVSVNSNVAGSYAISINDSDAAIGSNAELEFKDDGGTSLTGSSATVSSSGVIRVEIVVDLNGDNLEASNIPNSITIEANEV